MMARVWTLGEGMALLRTSGIGPLETQHSLTLSSGGAEMNVAIGLARWGIPVRWVGRVGDDAFGRLVRRDLQAEGVDARVTVDPVRPTGMMIKEARSSAKSRVTYYRTGSAGSAIAADSVADGDLDSIEIVHVTGITPALSPSARSAVTAAVEAAVHHEIPVSFDINHRPSLISAVSAQPLYTWIAERSSIVFGGVEEAQIVAPRASNERELAHRIAALGPTEVLIKRGADGCTALIDGELIEEPGVPVDVVDTVGAGDAFVAGYLAARLGEQSPRDRVRLACRAGAAACLTPGDWDGAPRRDELDWLLGDADPVAR